MNQPIIIAVLVLLVAAAAYSYYAKRAPVRKLTDEDTTAEMRVRSQYAVESGSTEFKVTLDFSDESVEAVENILAQIHGRYKSNLLDNSQLTKECLKWGGYIGEVIRRNHGGEWRINPDSTGVGAISILHVEQTGESFPIAWCSKRIENGEDDNVWHKFKIFVIDKVQLEDELDD